MGGIRSAGRVDDARRANSAGRVNRAGRLGFVKLADPARSTRPDCHMDPAELIACV